MLQEYTRLLLDLPCVDCHLIHFPTLFKYVNLTERHLMQCRYVFRCIYRTLTNFKRTVQYKMSFKDYSSNCLSSKQRLEFSWFVLNPILNNMNMRSMTPAAGVNHPIRFSLVG